MYKSSLGDDVEFDELSLLKAELPNGGARIVPPPEQNSLSLEVPMLVEPVAVQKVAKPRKRTKKVREIPMLMEVADYQNIDDTPVQTSLALDFLQEETVDEKQLSLAGPEQEPDSRFTMPSEPDQESIPSFTMPSEPDTEVQVARNVDYSTREKLVIVYIMAKQGNFMGEELLQAMQDHDMVYGEMKIFHRLSREGLSEFSLSSAVEPGSFDIAGMDNLLTPGVTMFLRVHELADPMSVYGEMMKVAIGIANKLGGIVLDETRNSMTVQTMEYCKQSIRDFQFRHSA